MKLFVIASQCAHWRGNPPFMSFRASQQTGVGIRTFIMKNYYVYILSNCTNTTIYTGITNDLIRRVFEHRQNADPKSFTAKYDIHKLVYYEYTGDVKVALEREKQIKSWSRAKKNKLVTAKNPQWEDLYEELL